MTTVVITWNYQYYIQQVTLGNFSHVTFFFPNCLFYWNDWTHQSLASFFFFYVLPHVYDTNALVKILKISKPPRDKTMLQCQMTQDTLTEPLGLFLTYEHHVHNNPPIFKSQLKLDTYTHSHLLGVQQVSKALKYVLMSKYRNTTIESQHFTHKVHVGFFYALLTSTFRLLFCNFSNE